MLQTPAIAAVTTHVRSAAVSDGSVVHGACWPHMMLTANAPNIITVATPCARLCSFAMVGYYYTI